MSKIIITGATGMVGKGVLLSCLKDASIEKIILISRRAVGISNPKIQEIILEDFSNLLSIENQIGGINACYHCMGVSSLGMSEEEFTEKTYLYTKLLADICYELNPKSTFCYVSGTGTDETEQGRQMWARVKGKTENYIRNKGFYQVLLFRPGMILPEDGIQSATNWYNTIYRIMRPLFPLFKKMKSVTTTSRIGSAMINGLKEPVPGVAILHNKQINAMANL